MNSDTHNAYGNRNNSERFESINLTVYVIDTGRHASSYSGSCIWN